MIYYEQLPGLLLNNDKHNNRFYITGPNASSNPISLLYKLTIKNTKYLVLLLLKLCIWLNQMTNAWLIKHGNNSFIIQTLKLRFIAQALG